MLPDSHASRETDMLQQLLSAQLERGHCVKWRGWPTAVPWPGRGWALRGMREWGALGAMSAHPQPTMGRLYVPPFAIYEKGRGAHGALPPPRLPQIFRGPYP